MGRGTTTPDATRGWDGLEAFAALPGAGAFVRLAAAFDRGVCPAPPTTGDLDTLGFFGAGDSAFGEGLVDLEAGATGEAAGAGRRVTGATSRGFGVFLAWLAVGRAAAGAASRESEVPFARAAAGLAASDAASRGFAVTFTRGLAKSAAAAPPVSASTALTAKQTETTTARRVTCGLSPRESPRLKPARKQTPWLKGRP